MNADKLKQLQAESRKRHEGPFFNIGVIIPNEDGSYSTFPNTIDSEIPLSCTSLKKQDSMPNESKHSKPYVPSPGFGPKKLIKTVFQSPGIVPDPPKQRWERPPAVYNNPKSPYGIYDELKEELNRK